MKQITIAIDGGAGTGKWTTAQGVARTLWYRYIDTGAMYRAVTLYLIENAISLDNETDIEAALQHISIDFRDDVLWLNHTFLNDRNVEQHIRNLKVSRHVTQVAAFPAVRHFLVEQQQRIAQWGWVVMDGRDMWTVVVPHAELKIHIRAELWVRAQRRQAQLRQKWEIVDLESIKENLRMRDEIDYDGPNHTSTIHPDARILDTTYTTIDDQIQQVITWAQVYIWT